MGNAWVLSQQLVTTPNPCPHVYQGAVAPAPALNQRGQVEPEQRSWPRAGCGQPGPCTGHKHLPALSPSSTTLATVLGRVPTSNAKWKLPFRFRGQVWW